ncbi:MAG TPA: inorganic diphosphatase [Povalibacter sp.]
MTEVVPVISRIVPTRAKGVGQVHVVVDTPRASRIKYKYDHELGVFRMSRMLPQGMVFPFNFGFIPGTRRGGG